MASSFHQKRLWSTMDFRIAGRGVYVEERSLLSERGYTIPFEAIPDLPTEVLVSPRGWFWGGCILWLLSVATGVGELVGGDVGEGSWLFYAILASLVTFVFFAKRRRYLVYGFDPHALVLMHGIPSEDAIQAFMLEVHDARDAYLMSVYPQAEPPSASISLADELSKLARLHDDGELTDDEYEQFKRRLLNDDDWPYPRPSGSIPPFQGEA